MSSTRVIKRSRLVTCHFTQAGGDASLAGCLGPGLRFSCAPQFTETPSCQKRKLNISVFSSMSLLTGRPPEWPDLVS
jgi:hypothetical protein